MLLRIEDHVLFFSYRPYLMSIDILSREKTLPELFLPLSEKESKNLLGSFSEGERCTGKQIGCGKSCLPFQKIYHMHPFILNL